MTRWQHVAILGGLALALLFAGLGATALTDRDEGANAEAAREMLEQGAWITPTLNYSPRFAKPALTYWLMAGAYAALGVSEGAARLPSAVAAAGLVGILYAFVRWALGPATAFRAALVLLLAVEMVMIGRMALTDALLILWTTAAGVAFFRAHHGESPRGRWYAAMYAAMGLAMLTKGPVGVLIPAAGIAAYLALVGGWGRVFRESRPFAGLALLAVIASPWYVAMLWQHGGEFLARARGETFGRVVRTVTGPGGTPFFYVPVVLLGFFPWSALLPGALWVTLRGARARAAADRAGAATVFAAAWVVAVLVVFSVFRSRLPHYVAPLFPFAALLTAATWPARVPGLSRGLLAALGLVVGGTLVAASIMGPTVTRLLEPAYPADLRAALPPGVLLMGALALATAGAAFIQDGARLFRALATLTALFIAAGLHLVLPGFSADFVAPAGALMARAAPAVGPCDELLALGPYRPSLLFYARRPVTFVDLRHPDRLAALAGRSGRLFVIAPHATLGRLPASLATLPRLDARGGYVLLASPPSEGACR